MDCFEYFQNDSPLEKSKTFFLNFITKSKKLVFKKHTLCFQDDTLRYFKIFWQVVSLILLQETYSFLPVFNIIRIQLVLYTVAQLSIELANPRRTYNVST